MDVKQADTSRRGGRRYWPVLGFLMLIALGVIAWILAPSVITLTRQLIPQFRGTELPRQQMQLIFTLVVFIVFALTAAAIVAAVAPRSRMRVREGDLIKERKQKIEARAEQKRRQHKINRQMRKP